MNTKLLGLMGIAVTLVACATAPDKISPTYVSNLQYKNLDCEQIAEELRLTEEALTTASMAQKKARSNDTVGVIFLGLPVSSLSGSNQAPHIAKLKGSIDALNKTNVEKKCFKTNKETPL